MITPNPITELLAAMDNDPQLEEALRQRLLSRELLELPQKLAELADMVARMAETFDRRLTGLEERVGGLADQQNTTNERLDSLADQQNTTNERLDRIDDRLDGLADQQNTTNDRLDGLADQQNTTNERLDGLADQQNTTNEQLDGLADQQNTTNERLDRIEYDQRIMRGQINNLNGSDYERKAVRRAPRLVRRHLGVRNAEVLVAISRPNGDTITNLLNDSAARGIITEDEADELDRADVILQGTSPEGEDVYVVGEISITIDDNDVDRASARARVLRMASDTTAHAAVFGTAISDGNRERARSNDVTVVILNE